MALVGSRENPIAREIPNDDDEPRWNYCGLSISEGLMCWLRRPGRERIREVWLEPHAFMWFTAELGPRCGTVYPAEPFKVTVMGPNGPVAIRTEGKRG